MRVIFIRSSPNFNTTCGSRYNDFLFLKNLKFSVSTNFAKIGKKCFSIQYIVVTYQIKALGLVNINLGTKNFFWNIRVHKDLKWKNGQEHNFL